MTRTVVIFDCQRFRFHLEPKSPLHMPAYNKDNVVRGGFGERFGEGFRVVLVLVNRARANMRNGARVRDRERQTGDQKADILAFLTSPGDLAANLYHRNHRTGATES